MMTGRTATTPALSTIRQSETPAINCASDAAPNTLAQLRAISRASRFVIVIYPFLTYYVVVRLRRVKSTKPVCYQPRHYDFLNNTTGPSGELPVFNVPAVANAPDMPDSFLVGIRLRLRFVRI